MTIKEFIEAAIEGGFDHDLSIGWGNGNNAECLYDLILDPKAWKAVIKVEMMKDDVYSAGSDQEISDIAQTKMHNMINTLFIGKTLEEYIATL